MRGPLRCALQTHAEEVHTTRQEVLYLRKGLEATFRKTLKDLEGTYRRKVQLTAHRVCQNRSAFFKGISGPPHKMNVVRDEGNLRQRERRNIDLDGAITPEH